MSGFSFGQPKPADSSAKPSSFSFGGGGGGGFGAVASPASTATPGGAFGGATGGSTAAFGGASSSGFGAAASGASVPFLFLFSLPARLLGNAAGSLSANMVLYRSRFGARNLIGGARDVAGCHVWV